MSADLDPELEAAARKVLDAFAARGWRLALAESCTGGLVGAALTAIAGSSRVVEAGVVAYSNAAKTAILKVEPTLIAAHGAVSAEVAGAMAEGVLRLAQVQAAAAVTGIAGPGGSEFKPEGRVCFGLAQAGAPTAVWTVEFGALGRGEVRRRAALEALAALGSLAGGGAAPKMG